MSFLNPSSDLCPNKQSKKPLNRSKKCPVLIQQTSLNPIHDFMFPARHPKYRNSGLQRKLLGRSAVVQFGGARLLTSRLARTLAPPKMQTVPLPGARFTRGGNAAPTTRLTERSRLDINRHADPGQL